MSRTRDSIRPATALLLALSLIACVPAAALAQGTWRVSVDSVGAQGNDRSASPSISGDGRFVAFFSAATNLVSGDTNGNADVFVHDRQSGTTTRVSLDSAGVQGNDSSSISSISGDGRFVAFRSSATNLVPGDTNGSMDVFLHDRQSRTTTRVSVDSAGVQGNDYSASPSISGDGRFVTFDSYATNLVPGDTNGSLDVFVHDRKSGTTTRLSVNSAGGQGNGRSSYSSISGDGRFVAFGSYATNLVPGDTNAEQDMFVHDRQSGTTTRGSVDSAGAQGDLGSGGPSISGDGRFVAFTSSATNLVPSDTNGYWDVFVHDRQSGTTTRVSVDSAGAQGDWFSVRSSISGDGRFVAFNSAATNLVQGDTNAELDAFLHDRQSGTTTRVSVRSNGKQGNDSSSNPSISGDGRFVAFDSDAANLVQGDTNAASDVFVHGPQLTLEAAPETVTAGATLALTTWRGQAGSPALLAAVDVNDTPLFIRIALGSFDGLGLWSFSATVPPGLSGNVITFRAFGIAPTGRVDLTNGEIVTFQ